LGPVFWLLRLAERSAQSQVAGREMVLRLFLLERDAQVLKGLVVALQSRQSQAKSAQQCRRGRHFLQQRREDIRRFLKLTETILRLTNGKLALADEGAQVVAEDGAWIGVFLGQRPDARL